MTWFAGPVHAQDAISFSRDIQPLFSEKCFDCHGPDKSEGGLRLDDRKKATGQLDSGDLGIVPGKPDQGTLLGRITADDETERMPPEGDPLTKAQVELIRRWIQEGAPYDRHWAYRPIRNPRPPTVKDRDWIRNGIDRFVLVRLEADGIRPSPVAPRAILVKRLYYDLIGLPPTPEQVDEFLESTDPNAYEKLVDRLLASRHFGERWGRHWLDKARYADSDGYEKDRPRPNAWCYRDWVIDAINNDLPFDQFTIQQLAGDLLPDATTAQKLATAFHRQTLTNTEGGTDQEQFRVEATFDRTETTAAVWLGLTLTCARCHSHKYDRISQKEYYQLYAFFDDANESNLAVPVSDRSVAEFEKKKREHARKLADLERSFEEKLLALDDQVDPWLAEQQQSLKKASPLKFHVPGFRKAKTSSGARIERSTDGIFQVSGKVPDKDKYTMFFELPENDSKAFPLTGIRIETLATPILPGKGPGRAKNGNFVLSQVRVYLSDDPEFKKHERLNLVSAEADFTQKSFSPQQALSDKKGTGWAIAPQMGRSHRIDLFLSPGVEYSGKKYLQVVLDQQYGGQHMIGRFRVQTMTGSDPTRIYSKEILTAIRSGVPTPAQRDQIRRYLARKNPSTRKLHESIENMKKTAPKLPTMNVRVLVPANRNTHLFHRGDFLQPQESVVPAGLEILTPEIGPVDGGKEPTRLEFARWLVSAENPITARVTVNQVWAHLFGRGIVATQNDFGVRGELPTHPELLDWLAWQFSRPLKWSRKKLIRLIVTSATYRQSSLHRRELDEVDPGNRLLARQNRIRVSAEIVRDLYLSAGGLLSSNVGGPSVFPPLPAGVADLSYANNFKWKTSQGEDRYRRGMYTFFKRTSPYPNLISFDCPDSNTTRIERSRSNTPIQALITLNNDVFLESAQAFARRILSRKQATEAERMEYALRLCIARKPSAEERQRFLDLLGQMDRYYQDHLDLAEKLTARHRADGVDRVVNAAWVATVRMILNLDEFIVRD